MIRLKNLILESSVGKRLIEAETTTPTTVYEFEDSFPDNIVLPIKTGQPTITSFANITDVKQLTPSLRDFINTLNSAITAGKLKSGNITIAAEASAATAATKLVPKGWDQKQVDFSYSNGATVSNQTLADRRAEAIESMIKKFVKLPADVTITKSGNGNGSKKSAKATVPILTYNKDSNAVVGPDKETVNPTAAKYTPPAYTDTKIEVTKCGSPMTANGMCGDPIAYRTKLEPTSGNISITFQPYYIPDRAVVTKFINNTATIIYDSGYVSSNPAATQVDFGKLLDELNKTKPNGYDGEIKQSGTEISVTLDDTNATYFFEVYAPLGPTRWSADLACDIARTTPKIFSDKVPLNGEVKLYFNPTRTQIISNDEVPRSNPNDPNSTVNPRYNMAFDGTIKNGKYFKGKENEYDESGQLAKVIDWTDGVGKVSWTL
jgi:hypothetical protein